MILLGCYCSCILPLCADVCVLCLDLFDPNIILLFCSYSIFLLVLGWTFCCFCFLAIYFSFSFNVLFGNCSVVTEHEEMKVVHKPLGEEAADVNTGS